MRRLTSFLSLCALMPALVLSAPGTAVAGHDGSPDRDEVSSLVAAVAEANQRMADAVATFRSSKRASTVPWSKSRPLATPSRRPDATLLPATKPLPTVNTRSRPHNSVLTASPRRPI